MNHEAVSAQRDRFRAWVERRHPGARVDLVETHISFVAFTEDRAYKCKKPVRFPFVDLSDVQRRDEDCEREVALNRRLAPDVYLGVVELTDPDGRVLDHVVEMVRMPDDRRLTSLIHAGTDATGCIDAVADRLAALHESSPSGGAVDDAAAPSFVSWLWEESIAQVHEFEGPVLDPDEAVCVAALARRYLAGRGRLLDARVAARRARDGHGDLLAEDVFCLDDGPRILDCLEFDDRLRRGDGLGDAAFFAMDLESLGHTELANRFLERYRLGRRDQWPASLADLYIAYRAHVRTKIACLRHRDGDPAAAQRARDLLGLAHRHLESGRVRLVLVGGPPGTGKSTVALALARSAGWGLMRSDVVRRDLVGGLPAGGPGALDGGRYTRAAKDAVYAAMLKRARQRLEMGESVVLDASWATAEWRAAASAVADATTSDLLALRCDAPVEEAERRVAERERRGGDASEADATVARALAETFAPWPDAVTIDTARPVGATLAAARSAVSRRRCAGP